MRKRGKLCTIQNWKFILPEKRISLRFMSSLILCKALTRIRRVITAIIKSEQVKTLRARSTKTLSCHKTLCDHTEVVTPYLLYILRSRHSRLRPFTSAGVACTLFKVLIPSFRPLCRPEVVGRTGNNRNLAKLLGWPNAEFFDLSQSVSLAL